MSFDFDTLYQAYLQRCADFVNEWGKSFDLDPSTPQLNPSMDYFVNDAVDRIESRLGDGEQPDDEDWFIADYAEQHKLGQFKA